MTAFETSSENLIRAGIAAEMTSGEVFYPAANTELSDMPYGSRDRLSIFRQSGRSAHVVEIFHNAQQNADRCLPSGGNKSSRSPR